MGHRIPGSQIPLRDWIALRRKAITRWFHKASQTPGWSGEIAPMTSSLALLASQWRDEADTLRRRGAEVQAVALESCADDLEAAHREQALEALTLNEASQESGYSYSALQKKVASGELPNMGTKNCPRVRRGDLPRKAGQLPREPSDGEPDLAGKVLAGS